MPHIDIHSLLPYLSTAVVSVFCTAMVCSPGIRHKVWASCKWLCSSRKPHTKPRTARKPLSKPVETTTPPVRRKRKKRVAPPTKGVAADGVSTPTTE
jgi:hypothetical protein